MPLCNRLINGKKNALLLIFQFSELNYGAKRRMTRGVDLRSFTVAGTEMISFTMLAPEADQRNRQDDRGYRHHPHPAYHP